MNEAPEKPSGETMIFIGLMVSAIAGAIGGGATAIYLYSQGWFKYDPAAVTNLILLPLVSAFCCLVGAVAPVICAAARYKKFAVARRKTNLRNFCVGLFVGTAIVSGLLMTGVGYLTILLPGAVFLEGFVAFWSTDSAD